MNSRENKVLLIVAGGIFILLKFMYKFANTLDLAFLLRPTNSIVELLTGSTAVFVDAKGFYHQAFNIVIDKSCSGFNFMLIAYMLLIFLSIKYFQTLKSKVFSFVTTLLVAYVFTILVNGSRIFATIMIEASRLPYARHPLMHEGIGIVTNLTFLILLYISVERLLTKRTLHAKLT